MRWRRKAGGIWEAQSSPYVFFITKAPRGYSVSFGKRSVTGFTPSHIGDRATLKAAKHLAKYRDLYMHGVAAEGETTMKLGLRKSRRRQNPITTNQVLIGVGVVAAVGAVVYLATRQKTSTTSTPAVTPTTPGLHPPSNGGVSNGGVSNGGVLPPPAPVKHSPPQVWQLVTSLSPGDRVALSVSPAAFAANFLAAGRPYNGQPNSDIGFATVMNAWLSYLGTNVNVLGLGEYPPNDWPNDDTDAAHEYHATFTYQPPTNYPLLIPDGILAWRHT